MTDQFELAIQCGASGWMPYQMPSASLIGLG